MAWNIACCYLLGVLLSFLITQDKGYRLHERWMIAGLWFVSICIVVRQALGRLYQ